MKYRIAIFVFALLGLCLCVNAQNAENRYTSYLNENGEVFFFNPIKVNKPVGIDSFIYDMTYSSSRDSVYFNFSIVSSAANKVTSFEIECSTSTIQCSNLQHLYIDIRKKKYEIRTSVSFSLEEVKSIYQSAFSPMFRVTLGQNSVSAQFTPNAWKKEKHTVNQIFSLIDL